MIASVALKPKPIPSEQQYIVLQGVSWATYQNLVREIIHEQRARITYDQGQLEIMVPLPEHESYKRLFGRMIETTTEELGLEIRSFGSCTWGRADLQRGIEADESYYIQQEKSVRGRINLDLSTDPAPDLVIEIDITSSSLNRMGIYARLGVGEVWRFDGSQLRFYILQEGSYTEVEVSQVLPLLQRADVLAMIQKAQETGETTWIKAVREWIRTLI
ncbi:Uma2 family endonuclease [Candidatus Synechococcus calcipolaris G9]|uniref:Uma2 family endonuclease n=1 Tax=Candidatus Synechococcus calcipolaris G9 TaxID=1497997 RepID=A0ABT6EVM4_9SYNE|nr:Uma2 family endonuclease [Candidatus Synechococcus calcipolaris]MDG2989847.1 Uma2 family endonuclease [Candidatus Synechococcus calcipolaris G9]